MITNGKKQNKGKPIFGLQKLPDSVLLKASRQEVGELKAYVDELEYKCEKLEQMLLEEREEHVRLGAELKLANDNLQLYKDRFTQIKQAII